jgi:hypothetical protein
VANTPGSTFDGRKEVAVAGTAEKLSTDTTPIARVTVQAETNNTGVIVVGNSTVVAAAATRRGVALNAGDAFTINVNELTNVWLDTTVNTDGVTFTAEAV